MHPRLLVVFFVTSLLIGAMPSTALANHSVQQNTPGQNCYVHGGSYDTDGDGATDAQEDGISDPCAYDTDKDGYSDWVEIKAGSSPTDGCSIPSGNQCATASVPLVAGPKGPADPCSKSGTLSVSTHVGECLHLGANTVWFDSIEYRADGDYFFAAFHLSGSVGTKYAVFTFYSRTSLHEFYHGTLYLESEYTLYYDNIGGGMNT